MVTRTEGEILLLIYLCSIFVVEKSIFINGDDVDDMLGLLTRKCLCCSWESANCGEDWEGKNIIKWKRLTGSKSVQLTWANKFLL